MPIDDDVSPIPSISAQRDGNVSGAAVPRARGGSRKNGSRGGGDREVTGAKPGFLSTILLIIALVVALAACTWAWQLQEKLTQTGHLLERYEARIGDLEDRLADTDEGMNQNATVQAAKIRELDSEVRKLWDNVWKSTKQRLGVLEAGAKRADASVAANTKGIASTQAELTTALQDISRLKKVSGDMERLMTSSRNSQAEVERLADTLNRINLDLSKINKRVADNEEWIDAINAFRQSTNARINQLQAELRALNAAP